MGARRVALALRRADDMIRVLSFGGGVQSTAVLRLSLDGELPPLDHVIFADTGWEPRYVYDHILTMISVCEQRGVPFHTVRNAMPSSRGSLRDDLQKTDKSARWGAPPLFIKSRDGSTAMSMRQCTQDYKIEPLDRKCRELAGLTARGKKPDHPIVEQWIGISLDEVQRMKLARHKWQELAYPLITMRPMTRGDCMEWMKRNGYPVPRKSACVGCPFRSNAGWCEVRDHDPEGWAELPKIERHLQKVAGFKGKPFLHRSCVPIDEVDLSTPEERGQMSFLDECAGVCGV